MAEIRCPNCGKDNPDFLEHCQFCQTPLAAEAIVRPGDDPVKIDTGELEPILPEWLRDIREKGRDTTPPEIKAEANKPKAQKSEPLDLLAGLASQTEDDGEEIPDWLADIVPSASKRPQANEPAPDVQAPAKEPAEENAQPAPAADDEFSQWFAEASKDSAYPFELEASAPPVHPFTEAPAQPQAAEDLSWLYSLEESSQKEMPTVDAESQLQPNLGWLEDLNTTADAAATDSMSVWLPERDELADESAPEEISPLTEQTDPLRGLAGDDLMPASGALDDWFRETDPSAQSSAAIEFNESDDSRDSPFATPETQADVPLSPGELPSWVQSMRPTEATIQTDAVRRGDYAAPESQGPLAGLEGVIPLVPIGSSRRPKAFSLKLQPTDEQIAGASLLENILASETMPRPVEARTNVVPQRALRWALSALFLIALGGMAFMRTESLLAPRAFAPQVDSTLNAVNSLTKNSIVLVAIDYEPALAGEMEAISGPLLDQLALSAQARLAFVSTSPNGVGLVSRLLMNTGVSRAAPQGLGYLEGENYVNLGYLPGGLIGMREFLEDPVRALPQAGQTPNFSVSAMTDYAAIVILTDRAESGQAWVEQLYARRRADPAFAAQPWLVAASAQAAPILLPYYSAQQIAGLVGGLSNAAYYEFINDSRPGIARKYWDSFGAGAALAAVLIALGGLWNLIAGLRARKNGEAG
ncbi:MAG: hypothetical protein B6D38_12185 [Anaerolineae bacterium UTCFX1]|jgi:hypothetical protein|nr:MAG: hypothetical protein B6D38_12185 [Anaerolineae bacterium UTCFX1]